MLYATRRQLLAGATALFTPGLAPARAVETLKIVVAGGHPGDPEYGCGGTIARYTEQGHRVTLLYLNRGGKGCPNEQEAACSEPRTAEAQRACNLLNAQGRFASQIDGEAAVTGTAYHEFLDLLAAEKPNVLFTQWPVDNHRDHRALSLLTYDAWLRLGKAWALYYYEVSDGEDTALFHPAEYVDISGTEAKKRAACFAHASQAPERFYALQEQVMRFRGAESGCRFAEAFLRHPQSRGAALPT